MLYRTPLRMLGDLVSPKALERIFESSAHARGKALADLDHGDLAEILKRDIFKRLQLSVPAPLAKKRIQDVLEVLEQDGLKNTMIRNEDAMLAGLEQSVKRFSLYFDWPEAQKLRALIGVARTEMDAGKSVPGLLDEGMALVASLERRLNEGLVAQANELAELKAELTRFMGVGGPKLRRLEGLIAQIETAQAQDTLSLAEIERARHIALNLRKLVESSVISADPLNMAQELPDTSLLPLDAQLRISELDRESEARDLHDLARDYDVLLRTRPDLGQQLMGLRVRNEAGEVLGASLAGFKESLNHERNIVLASQREQIKTLAVRVDALGANVPGTTRDEVRLALEVARGTLSGGALASGEIERLEDMLRTLEGQAHATAERTGALLALQRELYQLEGSARGVRGAEADLAPRIAEARAAIARGELVSLDDLWSALERRMGQLAQERESFDARADYVVQEYDRYRHLAGETVQTLGRLADNLRRVRRLGTLSTEASGKYEDTLIQAEALLGEARAEFEAARELTSTFGADALEGLLGVFDSGGALDSLFGTDTPSAPALSVVRTASEPLALALEALSAHGGAQLALLRSGTLSWGKLDATSEKAALSLAGAGALLGGTRLATLELEDGGLLALPLRDAILIARVDGAESLAAWREQLLEARASLV
ncbi:hypothetical protein [Deinococcus peraridilitoris]|uniref:Uncharacterized protein n=1 Tax=Deinococcus peraridilitoris (strain DSM 19664 / LMG 22246 / CIP 109416 / KR-200) TaxID=937777 RepID=L0A4B9_DEIPD|nr:hypothetical protein [Deinococcus peraridilitoris]AFZ67875.1 hypothetical protein Deipe_2399 [Deinococcus peraridilitoris DSM 19664]